MKKAFKMKQKAFFITFEGLSLKQIRIFFLEGESSTLTILPGKNNPQVKFQRLRKVRIWIFG